MEINTLMSFTHRSHCSKKRKRKKREKRYTPSHLLYAFLYFFIGMPFHSGGIFSIIIRMPAAQGLQALTSGMFGVR